MGELAAREDGALTDYSPEDGLKAIAVAEAAEKHFARAKDIVALFEAIEAKLGEQRRFVMWWDEQEKNPGGTPSQTDEGGVTVADMGLNYDTIHRWRKRLKDELKFANELEKAQARCQKIIEFQQGGADTKSVYTHENEWYTPIRYIDAVRDFYGGAIELDAASSEQAQETIQAERYFTIDDDALSQEWHGRVWLNPPYAQPAIAEFVSKLIAEHISGRVPEAVLLTHNYTDTAWFHTIAEAASAICFTRGRIRFYNTKDEEASPTQGQAFSYFGGNLAEFVEVFRQFGFVAVVPR
jgi:phage N-6-adenine-methyltransferase